MTLGHHRGWKRAVRAIAAVEGRKVLGSPVFLGGVAFALLGAAIFVQAILGAATAGQVTWNDEGWTLHVGIFLLGLFVMVAANRAALRDRREGTTEDHEALPVPRSVRLGGLLLAQAWPAAVGVLVFVVTAVFAATRIDVPAIEIVNTIQRFAMVMMLGALGVVLAVWLPHSFVAPIVALGFYIVTPPEVEAAWQSVFPFRLFSTAGLAAWHLIYLLGLAGLFAAVGLVRFGPRRSVLLGLAGSIVAVGVSLFWMFGGACPSVGPCLF